VRYLKAMNTLDFLLEDLIHKAVLLHHRDPFKCLARNSNSIERPTATYSENIKSEYTRMRATEVAYQRRPVRAARRVENVPTACHKLLVRPHQALRVMMRLLLLPPPPPPGCMRRQQYVGGPADEVMALPFE